MDISKLSVTMSNSDLLAMVIILTARIDVLQEKLIDSNIMTENEEVLSAIVNEKVVKRFQELFEHNGDVDLDGLLNPSSSE